MSNFDFSKHLDTEISRVKVIRENYWPILEWTKSSEYISGYLQEVLIIIQWFWWHNPAPFFVTNEVKSDHQTVIKHLSGFRRGDVEMNHDVISALEFYQNQIQTIFWTQDLSNIPSRIIRISSLYDINVRQFDTIDNFVNWIITNLKLGSQYFWQKDYSATIQETSEMQIINNWHYPPLRISHRNTMAIWEVQWKKILMHIIPWYSPLWIMYKFGIEWDFDNYFFFISVYFDTDKDGACYAVISCLQYNFVNIWKDVFWDIWAYDETDWSQESYSPLEKNEESRFRKQLEDVFMENPIEHFLELCIENLRQFWVWYIEIVDPKENFWLMEHNQNRSEDSILKSWRNMYTKPWVAIWWILQENGRVYFSL